MGWRFRKSFKILPGLRLNIGKTGITGAAVGKRGFTTSIGKRGIYQNLGIPGTGLSYRSKVDGSSSMAGPLIGVGIVAAIVVDVIALCVAFASIGRNTGQQETPKPARLVTNNPTPPTPQPTTRETKRKSKPSRAKRASPKAVNPAASSRYIRGPRGGCYYINSRGNKT